MAETLKTVTKWRLTSNNTTLDELLRKEPLYDHPVVAWFGHRHLCEVFKRDQFSVVKVFLEVPAPPKAATKWRIESPGLRLGSVYDTFEAAMDETTVLRRVFSGGTMMFEVKRIEVPADD